MCSTIGYSLLSACDGCQGSDWISWTKYGYNCMKTMPPGSFPNPIPAGTHLPQWVLLDVTNENNWNPNKSYAVGGGNPLPCLRTLPAAFPATLPRIQSLLYL
ncbi:hypothetical protein F5888DRAFT_1694398 [Russula emetica]|nr:hypothetical protein F5888DRAFT_1694398 [Russula emetica]